MICMCGTRTEIKSMLDKNFKLCICPNCKKSFLFDTRKNLEKQADNQIKEWQRLFIPTIEHFEIT